MHIMYCIQIAIGAGHNLMIFFCNLKPHVQFQNHMKTPSGRKVCKQREREEKKTPLIDTKFRDSAHKLFGPILNVSWGDQSETKYRLKWRWPTMEDNLKILKVYRSLSHRLSTIVFTQLRRCAQVWQQVAQDSDHVGHTASNALKPKWTHQP